ncbi:MAG: succinate dehydrogenase assembly factor 2 [Alphaproteobacteria bacterium]|nr:succinate dehydrogenase assembly factor 2 [Alphaproteobacteria bacterium]
MSQADHDLDIRRKRALFRAGHRGMKELDLILGRFAEHNAGAFDSSELAAFEELLEHQDQDIYDWLAGRKPQPPGTDTVLCDRLAAFCARGAHRPA